MSISWRPLGWPWTLHGREVSDVLTAGGMHASEALRSSLMLSILSLVIPLVLLLLLLKRLGPAEATRIERARAAGEVISESE